MRAFMRAKNLHFKSVKITLTSLHSTIKAIFKLPNQFGGAEAVNEIFEGGFVGGDDNRKLTDEEKNEISERFMGVAWSLIQRK